VIYHYQQTFKFCCWSGSDIQIWDFYRNFHHCRIGSIAKVLWDQLP